MNNEQFVLRRPDGTYLTDDFETWSPDGAKAHIFIPGAALNACVERWRKHGAQIVAKTDVEFSLEIAGLEHGLRALAGSCETCGCPDGVELESSCTAYAWDGEGSNPNRRRQLCRPCAKDHYEFWDEMWSYARG